MAPQCKHGISIALSLMMASSKWVSLEQVATNGVSTTGNHRRNTMGKAEKFVFKSRSDSFRHEIDGDEQANGQRASARKLLRTRLSLRPYHIKTPS